ncbi:hypothetical protein ABIC44_002312 [Sphingomonas sp. 1185]
MIRMAAGSAMSRPTVPFPYDDTPIPSGGKIARHVLLPS